MTGMFSFFVFFIGAGLFQLPVGLPPAPPDARLTAVAPDDCLAYVSWAATAAADKNSKNHTEMLLAEPEVRDMVATIEKEIIAAIRREAGNRPEEQLLAGELPGLVKMTLTHATTIYLTKLAPVPNGGVELDGAIVINAADQAAKAKDSLTAIEGLYLKEMRGAQAREVKVGQTTLRVLPAPPGFPQIAWGLADTYIVIGFNEAAARRCVERLTGDPKAAAQPAWLVNLRKQIPVERPSAVTYVNVKAINAMAAGMGGDRVKGVLTALGIDKVRDIGAVGGLDGASYVTRALIQQDGELTGILAPFRGRPLAAEDLAAIPNDSSIALALRLDPADLFKEISTVVAALDARTGQEFQQGVAFVEQQLGFKLHDDLFAPLGDAWQFYNSPTEGGLIFTGLTAVNRPRDLNKFRATHEKLVALMKKEMGEPGPREPGERRFRRGVFLKETEFRGQKIYFLNSMGEEMPFAPAWCLTDKELIVAFFPQQVKAYLSRGERVAAGLKVPDVQALFKDRGPVMLAYVDTPNLFKQVYPVLNVLATFLCSELQREGIMIDVSVLPSTAAILPHLTPDTLAVYKVDGGLMVESRQSIPILGPSSAMAFPLMGGFAFTARHAHADVQMVAPAPAVVEERIIRKE